MVCNYNLVYNYPMQTKPQIEQARDIIRKNPHLIWYSKNYDGFEERTIFEHVLNYGQWEDVQELVRIYGFKESLKVLKELTKGPRQNLYPQVSHYFNLYFSQYA
jgi:hypothetical protein